jgi:CubicO group peptidase (beta-lactamase class C family)
MAHSASFSLEGNAAISDILKRHKDVAGMNIAYMYDYETHAYAAGYARVSTSEAMSTNHFMEAASLSKTVGAAFAIEYFRDRGITMQTSVNALLKQAGATWSIKLPLRPGTQLAADFPNQVTLAMLVNHTALGMHYVYGLPLAYGMPPTELFLNGSLEREFGYAPLYLERKPGSSFKYSGGGFIVLQYLLETLEGKPIDEIMQPFFVRCDMPDFSFNARLPLGVRAAFGHFTREKEVAPHDGGRLAFPALAAGGLCTATSLLNLLAHLARAYRAYEDGNRAFVGPIAPETARLMLDDGILQDLGSMDFMRARIGLGVFVARAGRNKIMLHQAANEGFRGVYFVCFSGPDRGKGFVLLCNGDNPAVTFQSEVSRFMLGDTGLNFSGVNFSKIKSFNMEGLKQEEIVNLGLKELVLAGFDQDASDGSPHPQSKL